MFEPFSLITIEVLHPTHPIALGTEVLLSLPLPVRITQYLKVIEVLHRNGQDGILGELRDCVMGVC